MSSLPLSFNIQNYQYLYNDRVEGTQASGDALNRKSICQSCPNTLISGIRELMALVDRFLPRLASFGPPIVFHYVFFFCQPIHD